MNSFRSNVVLPALVLVLAGSLTACSPGASSGSAEPDYADDEAMAVVADGLEARFDVADEHDESGEESTSESYAEAIQAELDYVEPLKKCPFEDSKLQEGILAYANVLDDSMTAVDTYPINSQEFYDAWTDLYNERTVMLKNFVDNYGLEVDFAHEDTLKDMLRNANTVTEQRETEEALDALVSTIVFEKQDDGYGFYTYTATVQNTSGINLENVSLTLGLYDSAGVKADETFTSCSSWAAGETVVFDAMSQTDAAQIKVSLDYYTIAE